MWILCLCFLIILSPNQFYDGLVFANNKRLLLNDPDALEARLHQMDLTIQNLRSQVASYDHVISGMQTNMNGLKLEINEKDSKIGNLTATVLTLQQKDQTRDSQIESLTTTVTFLQQKGNGASYVRWGKTRCSGLHTELVYSGYAAGQYYYHPDFSTHYGGPADTLCLPDDPQLSNTTFTETDSLIRGTEYEGNTFAFNSHNEDVPCAVCRTTNASSSIMIPGRQSCYPGWSLEYGGFLASGNEAHSASDYVCVDSNPEYIPSGKAGNDGHLFYMVGIKCGPLPCPPYEDNRKVNCVVCSK